MTSWYGVDSDGGDPSGSLRLPPNALTMKIERSLGTERARLSTFRGFGTKRARLGNFRGFDIKRERLGTFRGFDTERARLGTFNQNVEIFNQHKHLLSQRFFFA